MFYVFVSEFDNVICYDETCHSLIKFAVYTKNGNFSHIFENVIKEGKIELKRNNKSAGGTILLKINVWKFVSNKVKCNLIEIK